MGAKPALRAHRADPGVSAHRALARTDTPPPHKCSNAHRRESRSRADHQTGDRGVEPMDPIGNDPPRWKAERLVEFRVCESAANLISIINQESRGNERHRPPPHHY